MLWLHVSLQGVKPEAFEKVESVEIKDIILGCIHRRKEDRHTVKDLLLLDFFREDSGVKVELVNRDTEVASDTTTIQLRLRLTDSKKRKQQHKENEAIQFDYSMNDDHPDNIAQEMVRAGHTSLVLHVLCDVTNHHLYLPAGEDGVR